MLTVAVIPTREPAPVQLAGWVQSATQSVRHQPSVWTAPSSASVRIMESVTTYLELVRLVTVISLNSKLEQQKKLNRFVFFRSLNPPTHKMKLVFTRTGELSAPLLSHRPPLKSVNEMTGSFSAARDGREPCVTSPVHQAVTAPSKV